MHSCTILSPMQPSPTNAHSLALLPINFPINLHEMELQRVPSVCVCTWLQHGDEHGGDHIPASRSIDLRDPDGDLGESPVIAPSRDLGGRLCVGTRTLSGPWDGVFDTALPVFSTPICDSFLIMLTL